MLKSPSGIPDPVFVASSLFWSACIPSALWSEAEYKLWKASSLHSSQATSGSANIFVPLIIFKNLRRSIILEFLW